MSFDVSPCGVHPLVLVLQLVQWGQNTKVTTCICGIVFSRSYNFPYIIKTIS